MAERNIDKIARGAAISAGKKGKTHRGAAHSEETKRVISEKTKERMSDPTRNPFLGKKRSLESCEKQSKTRSEKIVAGEYSGWFDRGYISTTKGGGRVHYKSSWEKKLIEKLEADNRVLSFQYEPMSIPYTLDGHKRHYVPDFLVLYYDLRQVMYEVKPSCFVDAKINVAKFQAANDWCKHAGWEFRVLTEKEGDLS